MTAATMAGGRDAAGADSGPEGVVLIHGLARSTGSMWLLAQRLEAAGFVTARVGYPSTRLPLEAAVAHVAAAVRRVSRGWRVVHLVGHSLGGVIARLIAERHPELPIGRVVQIAAPNAGSAVAATIGRLSVARNLLGPALEEIPRLAPARTRMRGVGAIAGRLPLDVIGEAVGLSGPNDGLVTVRSAWEGAEAHIALPSVHGLMPLSAEVGRQVARYLREGRFAEPPA